ncbi:MAG: hypothetical protein GYA36_16705 [Veillonellaceae bacterium]|nr:hypothetical protein [Veillonellaceae bacterium]
MAFEPNNPPEETETLEVHLDTFQRIGVLLLVFAVIFSVIGYFVSPHDEDGKPILLLPEVRQMETYRRSANGWIQTFQALDSQIASVAANQQSDLFAQSREAQNALQQAVRLAQEVDRTAFPPSAISLHDDLAGTSLAYLEAARKMMIWVGAPEETNRAQLDTALITARQSYQTLEKNKWLEER